MSIKGSPIGWPIVQPDYAQTNTTAADYIKNKPDIQSLVDNSLSNAKSYADVKCQEAKSYTDTKANEVKTYVGTYVDAKKKSMTVTLWSSSWYSNSQSVTANGVTTSNTVIVSPTGSYWKAYCEAGVYCSGQSSNSLTFKCEDVPTENITVNVLILN